jgi:hypothetical protein
LATQNLSDVNITGGNIVGISPLPVLSGGTGSGDPSSARLNLGLGTMSTQNASDVVITGGVIQALTSPLGIGQGGTGATTASAARIALGLESGATTVVGSIATQNSNAVSITGGTITGITALAIAEGGTGSTTASGARSQLGAAASAVSITGTGGLTGGGDLTTSRTISIASSSNGFGTRTVSTNAPSGGSNGDIWYQV